MNKNDEEIKELFAKLRLDDDNTVPSFNQVLTKEKSRGTGAGPLIHFRVRPLVVGLFLLFLVGASSLYLFWPSSNPEVELTEDLIEWEAPTDFLLSFNDESQFEELPEIGTSFWESEVDLEN
jgi:hypothetical protein